MSNPLGSYALLQVLTHVMLTGCEVGLQLHSKEENSTCRV